MAICLLSKKLNQIDFCFKVKCFKIFFDRFLKWIDGDPTKFGPISTNQKLLLIKSTNNENCTFSENISYQSMVLTKILENQNLEMKFFHFIWTHSV